jgi:hypothetical protein
MATAVPVTIDSMTPTSGVLVDTMTPDYYTFMGTAGQRLLILANAYVGSNAGMAETETITDTVISVYEPGNTTQWIAQDDDAWPRVNTDSQLFVELPVTGQYYYTIQDCNAAFTAGCAPAADVMDFAYQTQIFDLTAAKLETVGVDPPATAAAVPYKQVTGTGVPAGTWYQDFLDGDFTSVGETQVISFTPPTGTATQAGTRTRSYMWLQPITSQNGDGSYANVQLTVKDMSGNIVAQADQKNYKDGDNFTDGPLQLSFPLFDTTPLASPAAAPSTLGQPYTLTISNDAATVKAYTDYFFIVHFVGAYDYGQAEAEFPGAHTNDTAATAETLTAPAMTTSFFADGNLVPGTAATDVDWYKLTVPSGVTKFSFACSAERDGSGLQGFAASVYSDPTSTSLVTLNDSATTDVQNSSTGGTIAIDTGVTALYLQITATGQSTTNTGTYYFCGIYM